MDNTIYIVIVCNFCIAATWRIQDEYIMLLSSMALILFVGLQLASQGCFPISCYNS